MPLNYVHVAGKPTKKQKIDITPAIVNQNGLCLYSLIDGFRVTNFNTHTIDKVLSSIKEYCDSYVTPANGDLFIDSGGYSIIKGEVHPDEITRLTQCYNTVLTEDISLYDRIFSLDIPWNKKYHWMNTKDRIYEFNKYSLNLAKESCLDYPEYQDKYYFVWHFKMQSQYDVWCKLYDELDLKQYIKNRAIGGMVGLREATNIKFSPFTSIAYRCLLDYLDADDFSRDFNLHFLGMYLRYDRFQMAILEKLFENYLEGKVPVNFTYDSINFAHTAHMNNDLKLFYIENDDLITLPKLIDVPSDILNDIYQNDPQVINFVKSEIDRKINSESLVDTNTFAPINIFSQRQLDLFFQKIVREYEIAELFFKYNSLSKIHYYFDQIMKDLTKRYPDVFGSKHMQECMRNNIKYIYRFHRWFVGDRSRKKLQELMREFIAEINFPDSLK